MNVTRRDLLKSAALTAAFTIVPRHVLGGPKFVAPSEKVNIAIIGAGGQGLHNARQLFQLPDCQIISLADPFEENNLMKFYFKSMAGRGPVKKEIEAAYKEKTPNYKCAVYEDFRVMLEQEKGIDAILCATPDHLHAYVSCMVMRAGKHLFCEKPLTHNIWEARHVAKVAKETGVATQMGNMGHSRDSIRDTVEWLRDGVIGTVKEVFVWIPNSRWFPGLTEIPTAEESVPKGANWDMWLGPRKPRPYHSCYCPVTWRDFWTFGTGTLGDFACHDLDSSMWALELGSPESVEAYPVGPMTSDIGPWGAMAYYRFPKRGDFPALKITWMDGGLKPPVPAELGPNGKLINRGVLFIGDKGKLLCEEAGGQPRLLPYKKTAEYKKPAKTIPRVKGHHADWIQACKGGTPASANFSYGARLTELGLLGTLSLRTGKKIYWDSENMIAKGCPEADQFIKEEYRKGWELV